MEVSLKVVTKKITGTGFIASLWAMNDLSLLLLVLILAPDLRQMTVDESACISGPALLGLQPSSSTLPGCLQGPHPPQSSSAGLICVHLEMPTSQLHRLLAIPRNLCKTNNTLTLATLQITTYLSLIRKLSWVLLPSRYCQRCYPTIPGLLIT